ncbi:hypothetical protein F4859DRAFT_458472 [Xylaria cf. heliscus]|nr:hypothetical protein F4859DRAFT_458472 [Xylaria cf. heliscus]
MDEKDLTRRLLSEKLSIYSTFYLLSNFLLLLLRLLQASPQSRLLRLVAHLVWSMFAVVIVRSDRIVLVVKRLQSDVNRVFWK